MTAERIDDINLDRLDWLCQDRGITRAELGKEVGIAESTLSKLFERERGLTYNQLRKLARYFDQGVLFLLEPEPVVEERVRSPAFRTLLNQKPDTLPVVKSVIRRTEAQRELFLSLREQLGMPVARLDPPVPSEDQPLKERALVIRSWLGLSEQASFEQYRTAVESKGILVFRSNGYAGKWQIPKDSGVLGFSLYFDVCPVIFVRKLTPDVRQTFTLMHELGHLLLHHDSFLDDEGDLGYVAPHSANTERVANSFAGHVLVTDEHLATISDQERPADVTQYPDWLQPQRQRLGVSTDVLLYRLVDEDRLPDAKLKEFYAKRRTPGESSPAQMARMYRYREPNHIFGREFVRTVVDALAAKRVTLSRASRYLDGLKIDDVRKLERHCAGL